LPTFEAGKSDTIYVVCSNTFLFEYDFHAQNDFNDKLARLPRPPPPQQVVFPDNSADFAFAKDIRAWRNKFG
jgi:hypothetical protein